MTRMLLLVALCLALAPSLGGCEDVSPEEEALRQRRDTPEPRAAPGTQLGGGMSDEGDDPNAPPPPPNAPD